MADNAARSVGTIRVEKRPERNSDRSRAPTQQQKATGSESAGDKKRTVMIITRVVMTIKDDKR